MPKPGRISSFKGDQIAALMVAEFDAALIDAAPFEVSRWHDQDDRNHEAVELIGTNRRGVVAVEHTMIESYEAQISDHKGWLEIFPRGGPELPDVPNAGQFSVSVPLGAAGRVPFNDRSAVAAAITAWVRQAFPAVPWPPQPGTPIYVAGQPDGVPFELRLWRVTDEVEILGPLRHVVRVSFGRPEDLEERRRRRLQGALRKKVPKLLRAAGDGRSILLLQDQDLQMSAPGFVSRALQAVAADQPLPDATYLFNTAIGNPHVERIHYVGGWWHDGASLGGWQAFPPERVAQYNAWWQAESLRSRRPEALADRATEALADRATEALAD